MPDVPQEFTGQAAMNKEEGKQLQVKPWKFTPPQWTEDCVDIKVECCAICGSCLHTITNGWGGTKYPVVAGHELIGTVARAGKNTTHKVGDRVGVGAQHGSCGECVSCKNGDENLCLKGMVGTYQGSWPNDEYSKGGYADYHRAYGHFAIPIPKELPSEIAAPMMCGGITTYQPLVEHGAGPGKKVGIVGIGGLGHFGLMWSLALGAETYAISHSHSKEEDVYKMGVPRGHFIATGDGIEDAAKKYKNHFDLIIVTSNQKQPPISELYVPMLQPRGTICFVGLSEDPLPPIKAQTFCGKAIKVAGSIIGPPHRIVEMLDLAVKKDIKSWIETRPMSEASQALQDVEDGKARYRIVLKN